jgi:hypothetical protein
MGAFSGDSTPGRRSHLCRGPEAGRMRQDGAGHEATVNGARIQSVGATRHQGGHDSCNSSWMASSALL